MKSILRILPVALALLTTPVVIPSVVEGPGRVVARVTCKRAPVTVAYRQPRQIHESAPIIVIKFETPARIPLRGACTPRAPAA